MATNENRVYPDFFKVHIPSLSSEHMQMPPAFIKYLPEPLPRNVMLRNRTGNFWKVMLTRRRSGVYLQNGWQKFVEDNDLKFGEFLFFKYDGSRTFVVSIYGVSGCKETRARVKIEEISDDDMEDVEYVDSGGDDIDNESGSLYSLGTEDETEDEEETETETETELELETSGRKRSREVGRREKKGHKGSPSEAQACCHERRRADNGALKYLQDPLNPFVVTRLKNRIYELHVSAQLINDYNLKFPKYVNFIDPLGELKVRAMRWGDQRLCIKGWISICRRNKLKPNDKIICEFLRSRGWVHSIKVHIIRNAYKAA